MKRNIVIIVVVGLIGLTGGLVLSSSRYQQWRAERQQQNLPPAENFNFNANADSNSSVATNDNDNVNANVATNDNLNTNIDVNVSANANINTSSELAAEKNLNVPFTTQAPAGNWDQDHEEFCEEASALMIGRYWKNLPITDPTDAEAALQKIKAWELDNLGFYFDTTAAETAKILDGLYLLQTHLIVNPTIDDIKREVAAGRPVIVPTAGRELGNPFFTAPGPLYHMVVIKGYTANGKFITNDAGTKHGADYVYDQNVIMNAMHDWIPSGDRSKPSAGTTTGGRKVIIVAELKS